MDTRKVNPKLVLFLLLLIFVGPLGFAINMHHKAQIATLKYNNVGDLITPVKQASNLLFKATDSEQAFTGEARKGKWQLLYVPSLHCDQNCQETLDMMGQIHHALNKSASQLERMLVLLEMHSIDEFKAYDKKYKLDTLSYESTLGQIGDKSRRDKVGEFYVIDPRGHIMMYYTGDTPPKGILKDLKKLMKTTSR